MALYYLLIFLMRFHSDPRFGAPLFQAGVVLVTPVKIAGLFAILGAFIFKSPADAAPRLRTPLALVFVAFALLPVLVAVAYNEPIEDDSISTLLSLGLLLVATRFLVVSESRMFKVIRAIVFASTFASLWLYKQHFIGHLGRSEGIEGDANYEALTLIMGIPLAIWMARYDVDRWWRRAGLGCVLVMGTGIVLTQSRAGLLAAAVVGLIVVLQSKRKLTTLMIVALAAVLLFEFAPQGMGDRFRHIRLSGSAENGDEESTRMHFELVKAGMLMIREHPMFGVGLGRFKETAPLYNPVILQISSRSYIAHDTYIQIAAECGLPILILFLMLIVTGFSNLRAVKQAGDRKLSDLANAMQLGLIGFCVAGASVTAVFVTSFWIVIFLSQNLREIAALVAVPARSTSKATTPTRPVPRVVALAPSAMAIGQSR
jgi:O-antigen ligase